MVRGVRWLGTSTRLVTFSSEKAGDGFRNSLLVTDVRSRASVPFREVGSLLITAVLHNLFDASFGLFRYHVKRATDLTVRAYKRTPEEH